MKIRQSRSFESKVKRLQKLEKALLDQQIKKIQDNPKIGEEKKGDLSKVYVHKFNIKRVQLLLSYRFVNGDIELIMLGPHENYYKKLKNYLKSLK